LHRTFPIPLAVTAALCFIAANVAADDELESGPTTFLGGPTSIPAQLDALEDDDEAFLKRLESEYGLTLAADYATTFQAASDVLSGDKQGASGVLRLYGTWTIFGQGTRNRGSIVAKVEHRHAYGDTSPADLASNVGYLGVNAIGFTDVGAFVAPLYWQQYFSDGQVGFVAGRIDPLDFVDVLGVGSQWTSFQNGATLANLALPLPDVGCGAGAGGTLNDQWIIGATAHDLNGSQTSMDCFGEGLELYKQAFVGWSPSRSLRFNQAIIMTLWHADSRNSGQSSGKGIALSANWMFDDKWMPFVRVGVSDGEAAIMKSQLSTGLTYRFGKHRSEIGVAVSLQDPIDNSLDEQTTLEAYYRWQLSPQLALTPSLQILHNPALNPERSTVVLGGLRFRYTP
jgi:porin